MATLWTIDLLPGSCAHEAWNLWPQRLPTNSLHIPCDEGFGEARFGPPLKRSSLDTAVCLPDLLGGWRCCHLPAAESSLAPEWCWPHSRSHLLRFLQCIQHHPATFAEWETTDDDGQLTHGLLGYCLPDRQATVFLSWHCSALFVVVSDVGPPQTTVLSPFPFTLYTSDFHYISESAHLQKFPHDSAVVGCVSDGQEVEYKALVSDFVEWSGRNHLRLNEAKTREIVIDFREKRIITHPLSIQGWWHWGLFYTVVCWGGSIKASNTKRLNKLIKKAGSVIGCKLDTVETVVERRTLTKLLSILDIPDHPLHSLQNRQRSTSSNRFIQLRCHKDLFYPGQ